MKLPLALLIAFVFIPTLEAQEKKARRTVPGKYPAIIRLAPPGDSTAASSGGLIQSELGGREMQFLQTANRTSHEQLALADLAKSQSGSEQIKAVAETLASTQGTENQEIARLAAEKHIALGGASGKALMDEIAVLSGGKFEKAWIERMIAVSEAGAAAYELGAKSEDAAIRSFAEKMLPIAQARLQMASRLGGRSIPATPPPAAQEKSEPRPIPPPIAPAAPGKP